MIDSKDFERLDTQHEKKSGGAWKGMSGPDTPEGEPDTPLRRKDAHERLMDGADDADRVDTEDLEYTGALRSSSPGPTLPKPVDHVPHMELGTGVSGKSSPLPRSSPLYDINLSEPADTSPTLRQRAEDAVAYAEDALHRGAEIAGNIRETAGTVREVASQYQPPIRETAHEAEVFTRNNPKIALALAFGAGVIMAKALRKIT